MENIPCSSYRIHKTGKYAVITKALNINAWANLQICSAVSWDSLSFLSITRQFIWI